MPYSDPALKRAWSRAYRAAHREEERARSRAYRAAHREKYRAWSRAYRAAHREECRAYWAVRNAGEEGRAYYAAYRAAHREERARTDAAYGAAVLCVGGERINFNTLPPELREVAVLLKQTRKAIRTRPGKGDL